MFDNVLFDLDGTLLDTSEGIVESVLYAARQMGSDELPIEMLLQFIGPPLQQSFAKVYGFNAADAELATSLFREHYMGGAWQKAIPYDGIIEVCKCLKKGGKKLAVATYKRESIAIAVLKHFDLERYCGSIRGADGDGMRSKADIINLCIEDIGGIKAKTVLVGDTNNDANGAKKAGVSFLAVTYGFGYKTATDVREDAIGVATSPCEILRYLS